MNLKFANRVINNDYFGCTHSKWMVLSLCLQFKQKKCAILWQSWKSNVIVVIFTFFSVSLLFTKSCYFSAHLSKDCFFFSLNALCSKLTVLWSLSLHSFHFCFAIKIEGIKLFLTFFFVLLVIKYALSESNSTENNTKLSPIKLWIKQQQQRMLIYYWNSFKMF